MCRNLPSAFLSVLKQNYGYCRNSKPTFAKIECKYIVIACSQKFIFIFLLCHIIIFFFFIIRVEYYIQNKPELWVCVNVLGHKDSLIRTAFSVLFLTNIARLVKWMLFHSYVSTYDTLFYSFICVMFSISNPHLSLLVGSFLLRSTVLKLMVP
jgi:hypothetical protein